MADNPRGEELIRSSAGVVVVVTIAVLLRILARWRSKAAFAADDWLIVASLIPTYGMLVCGHFMVSSGGAGRPIVDLTPAEVTIFLKTLMATLITYSLTITLVKMSILLMYRRIFETKTFRKVTNVVGAACIAWNIAEILSDIFQCHPIMGAWNPAFVFTNRCINLQAYFWGISASNMVLDIIILCLPLRMVWSLRVPRKQKYMLLGIFLLGGLVCVASIMRMFTLTFMSSSDLTYSIITPYLWSQLEPSTAILCACLTTYRPLFSNLNLNLSFLSSKNHSRRVQSGDEYWSNLSGAGSDKTDAQWPGTKDVRSHDSSDVLQDLNAKTTNGELHVVHLGRDPKLTELEEVRRSRYKDESQFPVAGVREQNSWA